jgi:chromosomal replication initiation ATPase DnaA
MYYKVTRDYLGMTLKAIGGSLRPDRPAYDHTTVMHSIRLVNDLMSVNDQNVIQRYEQVMSFIRQKSDKISTIMVKAGMDDMQKLMTYLQGEDIPFTVLESVILQETKSTEDAL